MAKVNKHVKPEDSRSVIGLVTNCGQSSDFFCAVLLVVAALTREQQGHCLICWRVTSPGCEDGMEGPPPLAL